MRLINNAILLMLMAIFYVGEIAATHEKIKFHGRETIAYFMKIGEIVEDFHNARMQPLEKAMGKMELGHHAGQQQQEHGAQGQSLGTHGQSLGGATVPLWEKLPLDKLLAMADLTLAAGSEGGGQFKSSSSGGGSHGPSSSSSAAAAALASVDAAFAPIKLALAKIGSLQKHDHQESKKLHDLFLLRALFELFTVFLGEVDKNEKKFCGGADSSSAGNCKIKEEANGLKWKNADNIRAIQQSISAFSGGGTIKLRQPHQQKSLLNAEFKEFEAEHVVGKFQVELVPLEDGKFGATMQIKSVHNNLTYPIWLSAVNWQDQVYGPRYDVKPGEIKMIEKELTMHLRIEAYQQAFEFYETEGWNLRVKNCHNIITKCQEVIWNDFKKWHTGEYALSLKHVGTKIILQVDHYWERPDASLFQFEMEALIGMQEPNP